MDFKPINPLLPKPLLFGLPLCRHLHRLLQNEMATLPLSVSAGLSAFDFHWKKNETPSIELIEFYSVLHQKNVPRFCICIQITIPTSLLHTLFFAYHLWYNTLLLYIT